jgi:SWI/SNF-related matrix-associated actin-dependent regulator of chromatin subfamily A member 5
MGRRGVLWKGMSTSPQVSTGADEKHKKTMLWIEPAKRERKGNYSIDQYYRDNMRVGGPATKSDKPKVPRPPKQVHINDFQFYPARLVELQNREYDAHRVS